MTQLKKCSTCGNTLPSAAPTGVCPHCLLQAGMEASADVMPLATKSCYFGNYVKGESLAQRLAEGPLPPREAAELIRVVALAVQHAHDKGVIHGDLKPSHIPLDVAGQASVSDVGLAKCIAKGDTQTSPGKILDTSGYMSPEQAAGKTDQVNERSDIYSLGAVLYAALCGRPPHQADNLQATQKLVAESEPVGLRELNPALPRDLETICLRCLNRNPAQRYESAALLSLDLERFLEGKPILARPVGRPERLLGWCRRNPGVATLAVTFLLLLAADATTAPFLAISANEQRVLAVAEHNRAEEALYRNYLMLAESELQAGNSQAAQLMLAKCRPDRRGWEWNYFVRLSLFSPAQYVRSQGPQVVGVGVSQTGERLVQVTADGTLEVLDQKSLRLLHRCSIGEAVASAPAVPGISINADGTLTLVQTKTRLLLIRTQDGTVSWVGERADAYALSHDGKVVAGVWGEKAGDSNVWNWSVRATNVETGERLWSTEIATLKSRTRFQMGFDRDDQRLLVMDSRMLRTYDAASGELLTQQAPKEILPASEFGSPSWYFTWIGVESGRAVLATSHELFAYNFRDEQPPKEIGRASYSESFIQRISISPDGSLLAYAENYVTERNSDFYSFSQLLDSSDAHPIWGPLRDRWPDAWGVRLHDTRTGRLRTLQGFSGSGQYGLTFDQSGTRLIAWGGHVVNSFWPSVKAFGEVRIWDVGRGQTAQVLEGHTRPVRRVAVSSDSQSIFSSAEDGTVCVWNAESGQLLRVFSEHQIDSTTGEPLDAFLAPPARQTFFADRSRLLTAVNLATTDKSNMVVSIGGQSIRVWNPETGGVTNTIPLKDKTKLLALHPGGAQCAYVVLDSFNRSGKVCIHNLQTGQLAASWEEPQVSNIAYSPDGTRLAVTTSREGGGELKVYDTASQQRVVHRNFSPVLLDPSKEIDIEEIYSDSEISRWGWRPSAVCFTPDNQRLVVGGEDGFTVVFDAHTGQQLLELPKHQSSIMSVAVHPDGSRIVTASYDSTVKLWDARSGDLMHTFREHNKPVYSVTFSLDGETLVSGGEDGIVRAWKAGL